MTYTRQGIVFVLGLAACGCSGEVRTVVEGNASEEAALGCFSFGSCDGMRDSSIGEADAGSVETAGSGGSGVVDAGFDAGLTTPAFPELFIGRWYRQWRMVNACGVTPALVDGFWSTQSDIEVTPALEVLRHGVTTTLWLTEGTFGADIWYPETTDPDEHSVQIWFDDDIAAGVLIQGCLEYEIEWRRLDKADAVPAISFDPAFFVGEWSRRDRRVVDCGEPSVGAWTSPSEIEVTAAFDVFHSNGTLWLTKGEFLEEVWHTEKPSGQRDALVWIEGNKAAGIFTQGCKDYEMEWTRLEP